MTVAYRVLGVEVTNERWLEAISSQLGTTARHATAHSSDKRWCDLNAIAAWCRQMEKLPGIFVPMYLRNPLNGRRHWRHVAKDERVARDAAHKACVAAHVTRDVPVVVHLIRYGPRKMDAGCGLNAALKPIRDGVADYFGVDDGDEAAYVWLYDQKPSPRCCYGARAVFEYPGTLKDWNRPRTVA